MRMPVQIVLVSILSLSLVPMRGQQRELDVLRGWVRWSDAPHLLQHHLNSLALELLEERSARIEAIRSAEDWRARQDEVQEALRSVLGIFPPRRDLNARITGVLERPDFRVEKIVFESRPNFYVTGCLFLPKDIDGRAPAILNVIGHTDIAFRAPSYQTLILNLVGKGFVVFAVDPIGQGERLQYYDPEWGRSQIGGPTSEHSHAGKQCFLAGSSAAHHFTWDGIRAIDYLVSRPEVDPQRIGVTGISGGGTQTSYISAVDPRVAAAAPANYICGFHRLLQSIGPQDAEQNFNLGLKQGLDHADFLEVRAPKPTLVVATTRDFFSIQGARETVAEAARAYRALEAGENLVLVEDDYAHGYTRKTREAIYAFFQKHLEHAGAAEDKPVEYFSQEELTVTSTGQLINSLKGETVFSLNRARSLELAARLEQAREENLEAHLNRVQSEAREISGFLPPEPLSGLVFHGRLHRSGYSIEKYSMSGAGKLVLPFLLFRPAGAQTASAVIYLHPAGKSAETGPGGEIEQLIEGGHAVLAPDLSGTGELGAAGNSITFLGVQVGRSIPGIRAADIVRCVQFLQQQIVPRPERIAAVARGGLSVPLIHAAAFQPALSSIVLIEPLVSFQSVLESRFYEVAFEHLVPNAFTAYDLPDLEASLAPRKLLIINARNAQLKTLAAPEAEKQLAFVRRSYDLKRAPNQLAVHQGLFDAEVAKLLPQWLSND